MAEIAQMKKMIVIRRLKVRMMLIVTTIIIGKIKNAVDASWEVIDLTGDTSSGAMHCTATMYEAVTGTDSYPSLLISETDEMEVAHPPIEVKAKKVCISRRLYS